MGYVACREYAWMTDVRGIRLRTKRDASDATMQPDHEANRNRY